MLKQVLKKTAHNILYPVLNLFYSEKKFIAPPKGVMNELKTEDSMIVYYKGKQVNEVNPDKEPRLYLLKLANGRALEDPHCIIDSSDRLVVPVSNSPHLRGKGHVISNFFRLPSIKKLNGKTLMLASEDDDNFFHWMFQIAPKFKILEDNGIDINSFDHILMKKHNSEKSFVKEFSELFNINSSKIRIIDSEHEYLKREINYINTSEYRHSVSDELYVTPVFWKIEAWMCSFIKEKVLGKDANAPVNNTRRFYISRRKATRRKVLNEDQLWDVLKNYNFELLELEDFSIQEEGVIFSEAECVIGPTGAGFSNLVYCNPGTKVIELKPNGFNSHFSDTVEQISKHNKLEFYQTVCSNPEDQKNEKGIFRDLIADVDFISQTLNQLFPVNKV